MSGAETARRRVVQRRIGGAEMALPRFSGLSDVASFHEVGMLFFVGDLFLNIVENFLCVIVTDGIWSWDSVQKAVSWSMIILAKLDVFLLISEGMR